MTKLRKTKKRTSLMGTLGTLNRLKKIQGEIQVETGLRISITDIMDELSKTIDINTVKNNLIRRAQGNKFNIGLRFD